MKLSHTLHVKMLIVGISLCSFVSGQQTQSSALLNGSVTGRSFPGVLMFPVDDSAKLSLDVYGNISTAITSKGDPGEPLGPGGQLSTVYNAFMYKENASSNPYLYRSDRSINHSDFGYSPVWEPNAISSRLRYRFLPTIWGTMTMEYNLEEFVINPQNAASYFRLNELHAHWAPSVFKGFTATLGKLHLHSGYVPVFDCIPLYNSAMNGIVLGYEKAFAERPVTIAGTVTLGQQFLGRTVSFTDTTGFRMVLLEEKGKKRNRNNITGEISVNANETVRAKIVGGFQVTPEDTTVILYSGSTQPLVDSICRHRSDGWHVGAEAGFHIGKVNQGVVFAYGKGDVQMGWASPFYINDRDDVGEMVEWYRPTEMIPDFNREGSMCSYGIYWLQAALGQFKVDAGVGYINEMPSKKPMTYGFDLSHWEQLSDSTVILVIQYDTTTLTATNFSVMRGALSASYQIHKSLRLGLRYDEYHFFNPDARSNIPEMGWQVADFMDTTASTLRYLHDDSARWEREAINTHIITPFLFLELGGVLRIHAAYACALYDKEVVRQSKADTFHGNFSLGATLTYRFLNMKSE